MSVLLSSLLLAGTFFALHMMLRKHADEQFYGRVTKICAAVVIAIAWALFAATQLGFIRDHAP